MFLFIDLFLNDTCLFVEHSLFHKWYFLLLMNIFFYKFSFILEWSLNFSMPASVNKIVLSFYRFIIPFNSKRLYNIFKERAGLLFEVLAFLTIDQREKLIG